MGLFLPAGDSASIFYLRFLKTHKSEESVWHTCIPGLYNPLAGPRHRMNTGLLIHMV